MSQNYTGVDIVPQKAFVSGTDLDGRDAIRSCALHYNLNEADVETILDVMRRVGQQSLFSLTRSHV